MGGEDVVLDRYLTSEITKPFATTLSVLVAIFASYSAARYLSDAASGLLAADAVLQIILLRIAIALEVVIPITFYLSVVLALGRLYSQSEMTALSATGVGPGRAVRSVLRMSVLLASVVGALSLYVRPWAYEQFYRIKQESRNRVDLGRFEAGRFYRLDQMER